MVQADPWTQDLVETLKEWVGKEKRHNPSWSLTVGVKTFSLDQVLEHVEKRTPEGKMLLKMVSRMAVDRFNRAINSEE